MTSDICVDVMDERRQRIRFDRTLISLQAMPTVNNEKSVRRVYLPRQDEMAIQMPSQRIMTDKMPVLLRRMFCSGDDDKIEYCCRMDTDWSDDDAVGFADEPLLLPLTSSKMDLISKMDPITVQTKVNKNQLAISLFDQSAPHITRYEPEFICSEQGESALMDIFAIPDFYDLTENHILNESKEQAREVESKSNAENWSPNVAAGEETSIVQVASKACDHREWTGVRTPDAEPLNTDQRPSVAMIETPQTSYDGKHSINSAANRITVSNCEVAKIFAAPTFASVRQLKNVIFRRHQVWLKH
jgi:hypothetical protein